MGERGGPVVTRHREQRRGRVRLERRLERWRIRGLDEGGEGMRMVGVTRATARPSHTDAHHDCNLTQLPLQALFRAEME